MDSLQSHTYTGAKPLISGNFAIAEMYEDFTENVDKYIANTLRNITEEESETFKDRLNGHPAWSHTQDNAKVAMTLTSVEFSVEHKDAQDLEYGNPVTNRVASGLIRSHTKERSDELGFNLVDRIVEEAFNA